MNSISVIKSAAKAKLPFGNQLRRMARAWNPYQDNPANTNLAITQGLGQIRMLRSAGADLSGTVLEFGSGWVPAIPLLFHVAGARETILTDVERLMDARTIDIAKQRVRARAAEVAGALEMSEDAVLDRVNHGFRPQYSVPWNSVAQPAQSVDLIISRTVMEHVPEPALEDFLRQFHRMLRPGGSMCHLIDNSDHWEHGDKSLSRVNFLRYGNEIIWRLSCVNTQMYQNRLRHSDYITLFERTGWRVDRAEGTPDLQALADLSSLPLSAQFAGRDINDLAVLTSHFVLCAR